MTEHSGGEVTIEEAGEVNVDARGGGTLGVSGAIVLGSALIAAAIYFGLLNLAGEGSFLPDVNVGGTTVPSAALPLGDSAAPAQPVDVGPGDTPLLGDPDAPVLVVEWSDYQCPFCKRMFDDVEQQLKKQYIDTGKVLFSYRDFAFLGKESQDAANATRCANAQGKFWEFHDLLFESQSGENRGAFSKENLKSLGAQMGLKASQFNTCIDSDTFADAVEADNAAGRAVGVSGTPTTFVNGRVINGAQPFSAFQKIIDEELAKAGE